MIDRHEIEGPSRTSPPNASPQRITWRRDRRLWAGVTFLLLEGGALAVGRGSCPMGGRQAEWGDPVPFFELVVPGQPRRVITAQLTASEPAAQAPSKSMLPASIPN